jgi:hypothetical protein
MNVSIVMSKNFEVPSLTKKTRTAKILVPIVNQSLQRRMLLSVSKSMRKNGFN